MTAAALLSIGACLTLDMLLRVLKGIGLILILIVAWIAGLFLHDYTRHYKRHRL